MFYDEPEGWDGDMRKYEGLDASVFQPPTDEEYRVAWEEYQKEQAERGGDEE